METEASFYSVAPPMFDGDNYQTCAVRMETYLEALDLWEAVEEDYDIPLLPNNPTVAQIKVQKEKKTKKSKAKACLFAVVSSTIFTLVAAIHRTGRCGFSTDHIHLTFVPALTDRSAESVGITAIAFKLGAPLLSDPWPIKPTTTA